MRENNNLGKNGKIYKKKNTYCTFFAEMKKVENDEKISWAKKKSIVENRECGSQRNKMNKAV